ncbi:MAG: TrmH family RNA methyltransferase [Chitinophagales bacterium]
MEFNEALLKYLSQFISDKRAQLFHEVLEKRTRHFAIALEDIFQPHNANAVIRSADCFGIQDIYTIETINDFEPSRGVSKGAIKWINRTSFNDFDKAFETIKAKGYQIVATSPHEGNFDLKDFDISKKSVFFFGAEKKGISEKTKQNADAFLKIPMQGFTESLNISVSAAIIMQYLTDKLRNSNHINWQLSTEEKEELFLDWTIKSVPRVEKHIKVFKQNWNK